MDKHLNFHCRFCAEPKCSEKLYILSEGESKYNEILDKMTFLNLVYVDMVNPLNMLPKTICFVCYVSLNKAYDFFVMVKKSQDVLLESFGKSERESQQFSDDDDGMCLTDDFIATDTVKIHIPEDNNSNSGIFNDLDVKLENHIKEEKKLPKTSKREGKSSKKMIKNLALTQRNVSTKYSVSEDVKIERKSRILSRKDTLTDDKQDNIDDKTWKDYIWLCAYCNTEFHELNLLYTHSKEVHKKCAAFRCIDCKRCKSSTYNDDNDTFELFIKHVKRHKKVLKHYCHYCDTYFKKSERLNAHIDRHTHNGQISCSSCGEILPDEETHKKHLNEFKNVKPIRKMRRKRGTPITVEDLTCKICHKVYKNTNSLRDHTKLHVAERKKEYTCEVCGKAFFKKGNLQTHIQTHESVRPHVCKICSRAFCFIYELRKHVLLHSDVKPFACEECGRCFRQKKQLKAHKVVHSDVMPYSCQFCEKAFRFKQLLTVHKRRHTGSQPYSCNQCAMKFTDWSNYNKHMKGRHGKDMSRKKINQNGLFTINPETGQMIMADPAETEEWVNKIMIPLKRGKKTNKNKSQNSEVNIAQLAFHEHDLMLESQQTTHMTEMSLQDDSISSINNNMSS